MNLLERRDQAERNFLEADLRVEFLLELRKRLGVPDEALERAIRSMEAERQGLLRLYQSLDEDTASVC